MNSDPRMANVAGTSLQNSRRIGQDTPAAQTADGGIIRIAGEHRNSLLEIRLRLAGIVDHVGYRPPIATNSEKPKRSEDKLIDQLEDMGDYLNDIRGELYLLQKQLGIAQE